MMKKLKQAQWLFFDVGDTLLDEQEAIEDWYRHVVRLLADRAKHVTVEQVREARVQAYRDHSPNVFDSMFESLGVAEEIPRVRREAIYRHELERPFYDSGEVLTQLAHRYRIGIIANQYVGTAERLRRHGWGGIVRLCISSAEEKLSKPDPAIFRLALQRAECGAGEAIMIGDRIDNDVRPAKALGMGTIRVRQGMAQVQEPRGPADLADATVDNLREVLALLA